MPITQILVWDGKHSHDYFDASTPELFAEACLEVMRRMDTYGFYYLQDLRPVEDIDIDALPEPYRTEARTKQQRAAAENLEITARNDDVLAIRAAVTNHDVSLVTIGPGRRFERVEPSVWPLLASRSDYEYEGVRLESVWAPDPAVVTSD